MCVPRRAFAVVETITSRYAIQTGQLVELSPQQLISCDTWPGLQGCDGGVLEVAFASIKVSQPLHGVAECVSRTWSVCRIMALLL